MHTNIKSLIPHFKAGFRIIENRYLDNHFEL